MFNFFLCTSLLQHCETFVASHSCALYSFRSKKNSRKRGNGAKTMKMSKIPDAEVIPVNREKDDEQRTKSRENKFPHHPIILPNLPVGRQVPVQIK
jgi:hypothetical protein